MKQKIITILECICFAFIIGVAIYNIACNTSFFEVSIAQLLTPFIALCFAFGAVQYKNDQRKAKEHVEKILLHLQEIVTSEKFYIIPDDGQVDAIQKDLNLTNRKINNYITILQGYSKSLGFATELKYIETEFIKYKRTIGEHISDLEYLSKTDVADGLFCREIDGLFCRSSPDIIVRRRCVLSHKRRGWLQPSPSFRYSRNLALQDELYHPVINNGPAVLVCVDKRLGTGPVNQSRDAG